MKKLAYKFFFITLVHCLNFSLCHATVINVRIVGEDVQWLDSSVRGTEIVPQKWESASSFQILPVKNWTPYFQQVKIPGDEVSFVGDSSGSSVQVPMKHSGVQFASGGKFEPERDYSGHVCGYEYLAGNQITLRSEDSCKSSYSFISEKPYKAYNFYRHVFDFDDIAGAFKRAGVGAGIYRASVSVPVGYFWRFPGGADSYQVNNDIVNIIVNYKPSFLNSVNIVGDGEFNLVYDTKEHTVKGNTEFLVSVDGHMDPGLKISLESSGDSKNFFLEDMGNLNFIPYNLVCNKCVDPDVIINGRMRNEYAYIPYVGENLWFKLKFFFEPIFVGKIDEGKYADAVTLRFEVDI